MPHLVTDAVVLHAFDYLETSRIYRLLTREAGLQSALARGARRSRSRHGSAADLFAEGEAQMSVRPTRDLQTLMAFDVTHARPALAETLERFTGASAIAEMALRFARDDAQPGLYDAVGGALDAIMAAPDLPGRALDATLAGAWHIVAELGFAPAIDVCSACHAAVDPEGRSPFSLPMGGVVCPACASGHRGSRVMPARARDALRSWLAGQAWSLEDEADGRAHQRLLREFLAEHLGDGTPLRAFDVWERGGWHAPPTAVQPDAHRDAHGNAHPGAQPAATLAASDGG
jgi:DNA repair protein RecO (recombination protein O)